MYIVKKHLGRLHRSLTRRIDRIVMRMKGYERLGTRYGGWWVHLELPSEPLLIDCGLGEDISFPLKFLEKFGGLVYGIDANPKSIRYCDRYAPEGMQILHNAFWVTDDEKIRFYPPSDSSNVSGSLIQGHSYTGDEYIEVASISLDTIIKLSGSSRCDVLKMDVEGAEYSIVEQLCETGLIDRIDQLLIEYHHFCTEFSEKDTAESVDLICNHGFELKFEGRNYIFKRNKLL